MPYEQAIQLQLKLTPDIRCLLDVDIDNPSPHMKQAIANLNMQPEDYQKKPFSMFQLPDEGFDLSKQRYWLHLHQISQNKKLLVKERNQLKKQPELHTEQSEFRSIIVPKIENPMEMADRLLARKCIANQKQEAIMKMKFKECLAQEEKSIMQLTFLKQEGNRVKKITQKTMEARRQKAKEFNCHTDRVLESQKELQVQRQNKAMQRQQQLITESSEKQQLMESLRSQVAEQLSARERVIKEKQVEAQNRISRRKQQEVQQCQDLLLKIEEKLNKSQMLKRYNTQRNAISRPRTIRVQSMDTTDLIAKYVIKQNRSLKQQAMPPIKREKYRHRKSQSMAEINNQSSVSKEEQPVIETVVRQSIRRLSSSSIVPEEKWKPMLDKQRSDSQMLRQIKSKRESIKQQSQLRPLKQQECQFYTDLNKIKNKKDLLQKISKWKLN